MAAAATAHRRAVIVALAAALGILAALTGAPRAGAVTVACTTGDGGHCGGHRTAQSRPLELAVSGKASAAADGTPIVATSPAFTSRQDWDTRPVISGSLDQVFRFAPRGVPTDLCLTATEDVVGAQLRLEACRIGSAGSSHQIWEPVNVIGHGYAVWVNQADGLVMTASSDTSGAPVVLRHKRAGTSPTKNWVFVSTAP